jgi:hypothetical protein
MSVTTFPDGSQLTSTALNDAQVQTGIQEITAQMLGITTVPFTVQVTLVQNQFAAAVPSLLKLYGGQAITGNGIPAGTVIAGLGDNNTIIMSNPATLNGVQAATVTDPNAFYKVRIGWQQEGQPGPPIDIDTVTVRASTVDDDYSRMRDVQITGNDDDTVTQTDIYTRCWEVYWTFYGPDATDKARTVLSCLITIDFVASFLADLNLYVNPDIEIYGRNPELFQGRWWERTDLRARFNEQITETFTVGLVKSVEVEGFTEKGQFLDITVTTE